MFKIVCSRMHREELWVKSGSLTPEPSEERKQLSQTGGGGI